MKQKVISFLNSIGLYNLARKIFYSLISYTWRLNDFLTKRKERAIADVKIKDKDLNLQIGAGLNALEGWINTDIHADKKNFYLNLKKPFTFSNNLFDFVYSEHVIEHFSYDECKNILSECYRIMKNGGVMRITTPDLKFLIKIFENQKSELHKEYIKWNSETFILSSAPSNSVSVINNYVRDWGHKFIYDFDTLKILLSEIGFVEVVQCEISLSRYEQLCNLENIKRHPPGFLELESLTVECKKINNQ